MRLQPPVKAPSFEIEDVHGEPIRLDGMRGQRVMLSFFRDVACPFCNLRVYELSNEYEALSQRGMHVIAVFRSTQSQVREFVARRPRPFRMVADPDMHVYQPYGVEHSWSGVMRAMVMRFPRLMSGMRLGRPRMLGADPSLLPADFLIDGLGYLRKAYYGRDLADHLPMQDVRDFAALG